MAFILILFPGKYCILSGLSCISAFLWHATFRDECHIAIPRWFCRNVYCINLSSDLLHCLLIMKNRFWSTPQNLASPFPQRQTQESSFEVLCVTYSPVPDPSICTYPGRSKNHRNLQVRPLRGRWSRPPDGKCCFDQQQPGFCALSSRYY